MTIYREQYYEALDDLKTAAHLLIRALDTPNYDKAAILYEKALAKASLALANYYDDEPETANLRPDLIIWIEE